MKTHEVIIRSEEGLHARPAADFVDKSISFTSKITLEKDGEIFNAKSITSVLSMGACKNDKIIIMADGADEAFAIADLTSLLNAVE
ncbi:Phosphocarrier, HPr family [Sodalis praecaptivus]|uniref:Phosphocarrier protein NPr n=1 Tax=Sodalis praecaptivus TaxID=1239307 RepID=W0HSH0_9GAMM|nr:HPr family phosphocarrier protein [Sodalis praecaptivus]AHF75165.1 Phosphocarrier, HPr family [Sodalis praecaptivus]